MLTNNSITDTLLKDFLAISTWQSLLAVFLFFSIMFGFWYGMKKIKIKFIYRVLIGIGLGLTIGIIIQAINGFPTNGGFAKDGPSAWIQYNGNWIDVGKYYLSDTSDAKTIGEILSSRGTIESIPQTLWFKGKNDFEKAFNGSQQIITVENGQLWVNQFNVWANLFRSIFINGIMLLTIPVVFLAIFRITSRPSTRGLGRISGKAVAIMLMNVTIAFTLAFWLGYLFNTGKGMDFDSQMTGEWGKEAAKNLPNIIWGYFPTSFIGAFTQNTIIPVMVIGVLVGTSVKMVAKKRLEQMEKLRNSADAGWDIIMSMLMTFMKIMPLSVMSMMITAITTRPIGVLVSLIKLVGVGYLVMIIVLGLLTLSIFVSRVNVIAWWKATVTPFIQGFATQSSSAALPVTMEVLKDEMKLDDKIVSTIPPLSTTMGLVACAGVQAGLILSLLFTGSESFQNEWNIFALFIVGLITTVIASLGIAGVPGTATVVTSAVLSGVGAGAMFAPVYAIFGSIDPFMDMGRTTTNVVGGIQAATIVAKNEGLILKDSPLITEKQQKNQIEILKKHEQKYEDKQNKIIANKERWKAKQKVEEEMKIIKKSEKKENEKI